MIISKIKGLLKVTKKINYDYYTFEYGEERILEPSDNVETERKILFDTLEKTLERQIKATFGDDKE